MCYYSDSQIAFYSERFPKARKQHKCCECKQPIVLGERYRVVFGKWDGEVDTFKTCQRCLDLIDRIRALERAAGCSPDEDTPNFEELYEAAIEHGLLSIWRPRAMR